MKNVTFDGTVEDMYCVMAKNMEMKRSKRIFIDRYGKVSIVDNAIFASYFTKEEAKRFVEVAKGKRPDFIFTIKKAINKGVTTAW